MNRRQNLEALEQDPLVDIAVIGGGATGIGTAIDAASRGYRVALFEQSDFAKGTSSRSTKLVHGGVRYLKQGDVSLVKEALHERKLLAKNAPHLVYPLEFVVPSYRWFDSTFYGVGLKLYDFLAGRESFGKSRHLSRDEVSSRLPTVRTRGLRGGTAYFDGAFDDARLAVTMARTADGLGAILLNHTPVTALKKNPDGHVSGLTFRDDETEQHFDISAKVVINATGPFADQVRRLDREDRPNLIAPSQGVHIVLDSSFLPGQSALMIPKTEDGRVLFAVPWHGVTVIGTTDTPIGEVALEPRPLEAEIEFLLKTANQYFSKRIERNDIRSMFVGIRPLVKAEGSENTSKLSRDHTIIVDPDSKLITVVGGKWTTYRNMAEDIVDAATDAAGLRPIACRTAELPLHGATADISKFGVLGVYGTDAAEIQGMMRNDGALAHRVHPEVAMPVAEVVWACKKEMARTIEDMLARRSRWLLLDARLAIKAAQPVAEIMQRELQRDNEWVDQQVDAFTQLAQQYLPN